MMDARSSTHNDRVSQRGPRVCFHFKRTGNCKFGENCKFLHEIGATNTRDNTAKTDSNENQQVGVNSKDAFINWRYAIPLDPRRSSLLGPRLATFFSTAISLVDTGYAMAQEVIMSLTSEGGFIRLKELLDRDLKSFSDPTRCQVISDQILPFLKIVTHPNVTASIMLEDKIDSVYNFLYGRVGDRGVEIFTQVTNVLTAVDQADLCCFANLEPVLTAFSRMIDVNGHALANEKLPPLAELLFDLCNNADDAAKLQLHKLVVKIGRRLGVGLSLPDLKVQPGHSQEKARFLLPLDPPGHLSVHGPRHDNDHATINDIEILPTFEEIKAVRPPYLPPRDSSRLHLPGVDGLLDRHFRLLREDTVGQLRDAIGAELSQGAVKGKNVARTYSYNTLMVVGIKFSRHKGLELLIRIDQPQAVRGLPAQARREWWQNTNRLRPEALVCIIGQQELVTFCTVSELSHISETGTDNGEQGSVSNLNMYKDPHYSYLQLQLIDCGRQTVTNALKRLNSSSDNQKLVEFPGVLLPSFRPTLEALKKMDQHKNLPFTDVLAPTNDASSRNEHLEPALYAVRPGFHFDLSVMTDDKLACDLTIGQPFDIEGFKRRCQLDDAQADALINCLTHSFSLIQGPPGTGKSYTGVALIKVLLAIKERAKLGPVLCVCYTNHALDQLLEHLVRHDVKQIIRIGSRSKSEILEDCNLRNVTKNMPVTGPEKKIRWEITQQLALEEQQISEALRSLLQPHSEQNIGDYLEVNNMAHFDQLFGVLDEDGFETIYYRKNNPVTEWLRGGQFPGHHARNRPIEVLEHLHLTRLSHGERRKLHSHWIESIQQSFQDRLMVALDSHKNAKVQLDRIRHGQDLRCLQEANVIGVTTTGLARQLDLLHNLRSKVLVCEEAGEVLEAHILTAMLPSLEHVILIGDHLQLPPHVQNYDLSRESHSGEQFSLDLSLFERLVVPEHGVPAPPLSILETQRRMHPSISDLIRTTLYPNLKDSIDVTGYPDVTGMKQRLFWLDHEQPEAASTRNSVITTSHSNDFEISMTVALVTHLVRQGVYASGDIAVLTPYLGQLHKIRKALRTQFEVMLNERDLAEMQRQGITADEEDDKDSPRPLAAKAALSKVLVVSTIDNFQGEEAQVVVISLVRSNAERKCGFLKTSNRINVLLSRAKHGMYIIGNSQTSSHVPMWADVIALLQQNGNFGSRLELECPRHKDAPIFVSKPDDFVIFSPEGGCDKKCDRRLGCGHRCQSKCHSETLHKAVKCLEPCTRQLGGCDHGCPGLCGEVCVPRCEVKLVGLQVELPCGHVKATLPCWQKQDPSTVRCQTPVQRNISGCGHQITVECCAKHTLNSFKCKAVCGATLPCGHRCQKTCDSCNVRRDGVLIARNHGDCQQVCGRKLNSCSHHCKEKCHGDLPCECTAACENFCEHSKCGKKCNEPCAPCASISCAASKCPHGTLSCSMPCSAPCDGLPCSKRCEKLLSCGHRCPTVCGEACPPPQYCQSCANEDVKGQVVDFITMSTYGEAKLDEDPCLIPACGHILTISSMDGQMEMQEHYEMDESVIVSIKEDSNPLSMDELKVCGTCRGSLRNIARYGRIVRRALLDESSKKFIRWAGLRTIALAERLHTQQQKLQDTATEANKSRVATAKQIKIDGTPSNQVQAMFKEASKRYRPLAHLRRSIVEHLEKVRVEEQPYKRVLDLVQYAKRQSGRVVGRMEFDTTVLQTRETIQMTALLLRCDLVAISDFFTVVEAADIKVDFSLNRTECEDLVREALEANQPAHAVEGHMFFAQFCAAERSHTPVSEIDKLMQTAHEHVAQARALCKQYTGSTQRVVNELDTVATMLKTSTFYAPMRDDEWAAVMTAMSREFSGTGHWYLCANGHPFTIGECGMPMQQARCPQCDAPIGGQNHEVVAGVERADDLERRFVRQMDL